MQVYDIIMLTVLIGATLLGAWQGLIWQAAAIASIFLSSYIALQFHPPLADALSAKPPWNKFLAMLILYLATSLLIWITSRLLSDFIDRVKLKEFDRQVGALLGLAKGAWL